MTPIIRVDHLRHVYSAGTPFEKVAIDDIDLAIPAGQFVGIIGHTGSGKSTFIQHLNGLLAPSSGTVLFDGEDIHRSKEATRDVRFQVGLVFQYPEHQLFEETVYRDIAFGPKNARLSAEEVDARVREAARFVGVDESLFERSPLELSGGQKRRAAPPEDEPSHPGFEGELLDSDSAWQLHRLLHDLNEPYKEVFSLRVFGELSFSQIGQLFGKSDSWARLIFYRAKTELRRRADENDL